MAILHADQVRSIINQGNSVLIDARGGADAHQRYISGHLEGAIFADLETQLSEKNGNASHGGRHPLPLPAHFSSLISRFGISADSVVVVYDDKKGANAAARMWWMLQAAGIEKVYVVSGGLEFLVQAGFELTSEEPADPAASDYVFDNWNLPLATIEEVARAAENKECLVIDVRENYRFRGESEPIDLVAGHIPGAVNIPYTGNLGENGEFLSSEMLAEKYKAALQNVDPKNVIVHCGSGVTACHTLLALAEAGISGSSLYVGSWSEWSRNDKIIATGD